MPITKAAKKAAQRSLKLRERNLQFKLGMKSVVKKIVKLADKGEPIPAPMIQDAYKAIDKAKKVGIIKPNTAARKKSRVARLGNKVVA